MLFLNAMPGVASIDLLWLEVVLGGLKQVTYQTITVVRWGSCVIFIFLGFPVFLNKIQNGCQSGKVVHCNLCKFSSNFAENFGCK